MAGIQKDHVRPMARVQKNRFGALSLAEWRVLEDVINASSERMDRLCRDLPVPLSSSSIGVTTVTTDTIRQIYDRLRHDAVFREQFDTGPLTALAEYNLTPDQICRLVLPNFRWAIPHVVAGVSRPRTGDALTLLQELGIRSLISLSETPLPAGLLYQRDLPFLHIPISDFAAPSLDQIEQAVAAVDHFRQRNQPVAVHCGAGLGRTGTILACYFVAQGMPSSEAIALVREQQPGSVETEEQEAAIAHYELQVLKTER